MRSLRLGVIGLSPGNGHPYSWSAIFNGYDPEHMEHCGFPVIPRYLEKQRFPDDAIAEAKVTHVWAQSKKTAHHIAKAALIPTVVDHYADMIGQVDGVLLARDDAQAHFEFAAPFLDAGIPIYIDKPLALSVDEARRLFDRQRYPGQIFTCSALRYAKELQLSEADRTQVGRVRHIHAVVPNDWEKYAVHVIEPLLLLAGERGSRDIARAVRAHDSTTLVVGFSEGLQAIISATGSARAPLSMRVIGEAGWKDLYFSDAFSAFKNALIEFVEAIKCRKERIDPEFVLDVVELIELGRVS